MRGGHGCKNRWADVKCALIDKLRGSSLIKLPSTKVTLARTAVRTRPAVGDLACATVDVHSAINRMEHARAQIRNGILLCNKQDAGTCSTSTPY